MHQKLLNLVFLTLLFWMGCASRTEHAQESTLLPRRESDLLEIEREVSAIQTQIQSQQKLSALSKSKEKCEKTCSISESICTSSQKICHIAQRHKGDKIFEEKCQWSQEICRQSQVQCHNC